MPLEKSRRVTKMFENGQHQPQVRIARLTVYELLVGLCKAAFLSMLLAIVGASIAQAATGPTADDLAVPQYDHIFVIMDENEDFGSVNGRSNARTLTRLARAYGTAVNFYGEVNPSEGNYVACLGGSTIGIFDDDAYYCRPSSPTSICRDAKAPSYRDHSTDAAHLGTQLSAVGLSWKGYYESIPTDGSLGVVGSNVFGGPALYAAKHSGFINFRSVQRDPRRAEHIQGFNRLNADLDNGTFPSFALIVPNLCNDMHGMRAGPGVPRDCNYVHEGSLIQRGDAAIARLVTRIMASSVWRASQNVAIVITFDEDDSGERSGCCAVSPRAPSNFGGGHVATIVITNHGPHHVIDSTAYNHYSLLRTIEDAFGIHDYLGNAARNDLGVRPMLPLFRTSADEHLSRRR
jgi:hypothetical protein